MQSAAKGGEGIRIRNILIKIQGLPKHWGHWTMFCHRTLMENCGKREKIYTILLCITFAENVHFFLLEHDRNNHI
jgi:hypothetical protein